MLHALLSTALAASPSLSPGLAHEIRLSSASTRPAGDAEIDVSLDAGALSYMNGGHVQDLTFSVGGRVGVTDDFEVGLGVTALELRGVDPPFRLTGPDAQAVPVLGAHIGYGLHPGPTTALAVRVSGSTPGIDDAYHASTGAGLAVLGAWAPSGGLLLRASLGASRVVPQFSGSYGFYGAGLDAGWVGDDAGIFVRGGVTIRDDGYSAPGARGANSYSAGAALVSFPTETSQVWLAFDAGSGPFADVVSFSLGISVEPMRP